jgi:PhnB protein
MAAKPVPEGYHNVTPYLVIDGAAKAIEFYTNAFGATELFRMEMSGGKLAHAEIKIGDSVVMLADAHPERGYKSVQAYGGSAIGLMIYLPGVDEVFKRAVAAGAIVKEDVNDKFYGDRSGTVQDPFGIFWTVATHVEDVSPEEMQRRMASMAA